MAPYLRGPRSRSAGEVRPRVAQRGARLGGPHQGRGRARAWPTEVDRKVPELARGDLGRRYGYARGRRELPEACQAARRSKDLQDALDSYVAEIELCSGG